MRSDDKRACAAVPSQSVDGGGVGPYMPGQNLSIELCVARPIIAQGPQPPDPGPPLAFYPQVVAQAQLYECVRGRLQPVRGSTRARGCQSADLGLRRISLRWGEVFIWMC